MARVFFLLLVCLMSLKGNSVIFGRSKLSLIRTEGENTEKEKIFVCMVNMEGKEGVFSTQGVFIWLNGGEYVEKIEQKERKELTMVLSTGEDIKVRIDSSENKRIMAKRVASPGLIGKNEDISAIVLFLDL